MGLLDKARNTQTLSSAPKIENIPVEGRNQEYPDLIRRIKSLSNSIDYASNFFKLLCETILINKGVFFYQSDEQDSFINLCSCGYDVTTNSRLRLDESFFQESIIRNKLSEKLPFLINDPSPVLKNYFSTREYGMIEEMYFLPLYHGDKLIALLLVTEWKELVPDHWMELFRTVSDTVSGPLLNSRKVLVEASEKYDETETINHEVAVTELINELKERDLYLITLNLIHLMDKLITDDSGVTAVNIKKEILSVFDEIPHSIFVIKLVGNNRKGIY